MGYMEQNYSHDKKVQHGKLLSNSISELNWSVKCTEGKVINNKIDIMSNLI